MGVVVGYQVVLPLAERQRWGDQAQNDREQNPHHHSDSLKRTAFPHSGTIAASLKITPSPVLSRHDTLHPLTQML
jgi:hypothetical protein